MTLLHDEIDLQAVPKWLVTNYFIASSRRSQHFMTCYNVFYINVMGYHKKTSILEELDGT